VFTRQVEAGDALAAVQLLQLADVDTDPGEVARRGSKGRLIGQDSRHSIARSMPASMLTTSGLGTEGQESFGRPRRCDENEGDLFPR